MIYNEYLETKLKNLQDSMVSLYKTMHNSLDSKEIQLMNLELKGLSIQEAALRFRLFDKGIYIQPTDEFIQIFAS